jgi:hypothetical protein
MDGASHIISVPTVAMLKQQPGNTNNCVLTTGALAERDNLGKFYTFNPTSTADEDLVNYNVIAPLNGGGRWEAVFTKTLVLPHGTLRMEGGLKTFFYQGVTAADGTCTVNLTLDGTATGTPIFTQLYYEDSKANVNTSNPSDAVNSCQKSISSDLKQLVHLFYRGNINILTLAIITTGINANSSRLAQAGTPVKFVIFGK